jgi:predicted secreted protein
MRGENGARVIGSFSGTCRRNSGGGGLIRIVVVLGAVHAVRYDHLESGGFCAVVGVAPVVGPVGRKSVEPVVESQAVFGNVQSLHRHVAGGDQKDVTEEVRVGVVDCDIETERLIGIVAFNKGLRHVNGTVESCETRDASRKIHSEQKE